ncbi:MAG TPA: PAS domain-containing protein [Anaerolineales bacterium]|nr:PAS domain-containing protein [Anaerolineales bacterium]
MPEHEWIKEFPAAVTVCDPDGIIVDMNDRAAKGYEKDGGYALIGKSLMGCHSEASQAKLREMLAACTANIYTIEKNGVKKLIYQSPWYKDGRYAGFAEISLEIPFELPHFVRD